MKNVWFHLQGYRDLPEDFRERTESVWITASNEEFCDPDEARKYARWNIEELEYADDLGFDGVGTNEHHSNAYGYPGSPHLTGAMLARRESDVAICLLGSTLPLYHPLRAAEELATIDVLSGGRLVTGWPVGTPMDTAGVFGIPPTQVRPRYFEAADFLKKAWSTPGPFAFNGQFTKMRYVNPWPRPIQKPHPPIWLASGGSLETYEYACEMNYLFSYLSFSGYRSAQRGFDQFWEIAAKHGRDDNPYRAGFAQLVCVADTDAEARKLYGRHIQNFYDKSLHVASKHSMIPGYMSRLSMENALAKTGGASPFKLNDANLDQIIESGAVVCGSPDTVAETLEVAIRSLRVGHLFLIMQIQSMPTELTRYSTRLYAEKVLPRLQGIWADQGYVDHWWPSGAAQGPRIPDTKASEV